MGVYMCCFKRLIAKTKRKAGWARRERAPAVTRPSQTNIDRMKEQAVRNSSRKERHEKKREEKEEKDRRKDFYKQKGWDNLREVL